MKLTSFLSKVFNKNSNYINMPDDDDLNALHEKAIRIVEERIVGEAINKSLVEMVHGKDVVYDTDMAIAKYGTTIEARSIAAIQLEFPNIHVSSISGRYTIALPIVSTVGLSKALAKTFMKEA